MSSYNSRCCTTKTQVRLPHMRIYNLHFTVDGVLVAQHLLFKGSHNSCSVLFIVFTPGACAKLLEFAPTYSPAAVAQVLIENSAMNKLSNIGSGSPNILLYQWY